MTDAAIPDTEGVPKKSKLPLIVGLILMFAGAGTGYFLVSSGLLFGSDLAEPEEKPVELSTSHEDVKFVKIEPISVSLSPASPYKHLRFRAELEVNAKYSSDVETIMPRIVNVLNGYLRAVKAADLADPNSLTRLRTQLLRRAQIVAGPGQISDLLIMEFVLN